MGNRNSHADDERPLVNAEDREMQNIPLFKELNLVIIGTHCAGKNEVGNAILRKKVFTVWGRFCNKNIEKGKEIHNRRVTVIRAPGWKGDLYSSVNQQKQTKQQIVNSVQSSFLNGPHAVLLALDVDSTITETTREALESLLTEEIWDHTVVMFTHGEKLKGITIQDQIRVNQLTEFIKRCGKRYCVLKKNLDLIEMIEYFIADKDASVQFCMSDRKGSPVNDLTEKKSLVDQLKKKLAKLIDFKDRLPSSHNAYHQLLDSKDAEIKKLNAILDKKEYEIRKLQAQLAQLSQAQEANMPNPDVALSRCVMCEEKDKEIRELKEELFKLKDEMTNGNMVAAQSPDRRRFLELNSMGCSHGMQPSHSNSFEMQRLHPGRNHHERYQDLLRDWALSLKNIMDELTEDQFKTLKYLLENSDKLKIAAGLLEGKDRALLSKLLIQTWGERQCIVNIRDIMKMIPRNDSAIQDLLMPFLNKLQETW